LNCLVATTTRYEPGAGASASQPLAPSGHPVPAAALVTGPHSSTMSMQPLPTKNTFIHFSLEEDVSRMVLLKRMRRCRSAPPCASRPASATGCPNADLELLKAAPMPPPPPPSRRHGLAKGMPMLGGHVAAGRGVYMPPGCSMYMPLPLQSCDASQRPVPLSQACVQLLPLLFPQSIPPPSPMAMPHCTPMSRAMPGKKQQQPQHNQKQRQNQKQKQQQQNQKQKQHQQQQQFWQAPPRNSMIAVELQGQQAPYQGQSKQEAKVLPATAAASEEVPTKKKPHHRYCKEKRDRFRKLVQEMANTFMDRVNEFDVDTLTLPPSFEGDDRAKVKLTHAVMARIEESNSQVSWQGSTACETGSTRSDCSPPSLDDLGLWPPCPM